MTEPKFGKVICRLTEWLTGEPCAVKVASTVRRGVVGKVSPQGDNSLAAYSTVTGRS